MEGSERICYEKEMDNYGFNDYVYAVCLRKNRG